MTDQAAVTPPDGSQPRSWLMRALDAVERIGNKLPDPAMLFLGLMVLVWLVSWPLSNVAFDVVDPRNGEPLQVRNMLAGASLTGFMAHMVETFVRFPPLGVVLVAMLGLGVAEHTGFIAAGLRAILAVTPRMLLTPVLVAVGILSHVAVDAGYVLVIPLGGVIFYAAGRHPLAGIAAAFAGVSGGFSATFFLPSSLDPLLAGLTQAAAQITDPSVRINPLNNYFFTTSSMLLIVLIGWFVTDRVIEPRLRATKVDGDPAGLPVMDPLKPSERRGLRWATLSMAAALVVFALTLVPDGSPWRAAAADVPPGASSLLVARAPVMQSIVPLILILFLIPGIVYGVMAGTTKSHRDVIAGMTKSMSGMGYYIVLAFFCAQFIYAFNESNLGALLAVQGASWLKSMGFPTGVTLIAVILLTTTVNLLIGSASAKWALLSAILVPMLMELGVGPDFTQAAYRVGDSSTNIITPLMPYFPLIVVFCRRYVVQSGIGTLVALMLPYSISVLVLWTGYILAYWALGIPLGLGSSYTYPP